MWTPSNTINLNENLTFYEVISIFSSCAIHCE